VKVAASVGVELARFICPDAIRTTLTRHYSTQALNLPTKIRNEVPLPYSQSGKGSKKRPVPWRWRREGGAAAVRKTRGLGPVVVDSICSFMQVVGCFLSTSQTCVFVLVFVHFSHILIWTKKMRLEDGLHGAYF
jgi:hypothetical protein